MKFNINKLNGININLMWLKRNNNIVYSGSSPIFNRSQGVFKESNVYTIQTLLRDNDWIQHNGLQ